MGCGASAPLGTQRIDLQDDAGATLGPYAFTDLRAWWEAGQLSETQYVTVASRGGAWETAGDVFGHAAAAAADDGAEAWQDGRECGARASENTISSV